MRAGRLDRKIDIERSTTALNAYGDPVKTWTKIAQRRSAGYRPLSGNERFTADQFIASQQVEFLVRYSTLLSQLNPLDRVIYPAQALGSPVSVPDEYDIYDIMDVQEVGRREGLRILAARRSEIHVA